MCRSQSVDSPRPESTPKVDEKERIAWAQVQEKTL
jgi:hypothetical protein